MNNNILFLQFRSSLTFGSRRLTLLTSSKSIISWAPRRNTSIQRKKKSSYRNKDLAWLTSPYSFYYSGFHHQSKVIAKLNTQEKVWLALALQLKQVMESPLEKALTCTKCTQNQLCRHFMGGGGTTPPQLYLKFSRTLDLKNNNKKEGKKAHFSLQIPRKVSCPLPDF